VSRDLYKMMGCDTLAALDAFENDKPDLLTDLCLNSELTFLDICDTVVPNIRRLYRKQNGGLRYAAML
jgi:hypothetical protein